MRISKTIFQLAVIISLATGFVACSKDDNNNDAPASDKLALKAKIDSLTNVYNTTVEGSHPGQYAVGARTALDSVLNLALQVYNGGSYTQVQVNNALQNLIIAGQLFQTKLLQEVSVANLMAFWKFNGNANDSSGHNNNGTLSTGLMGSSATTAVDAGVLPQLVADRFGRANMAYDFNNAATVEVPYSATLNPQSFTICVWVKRHTTNANNYIISLNRWNGFKFQLQSDNFPFVTFQDTNNGYHDIDDNPGTVPQDVWTHVAVSVTNGAVRFYINGNMTKTVNVSGTPITVNPPVNISIGNELPKSGYNLTDASSPNYFYGASFFVGSLDDIRFYNSVLSDAEVLSIYTQEKSL